jgi:hypothetical protein
MKAKRSQKKLLRVECLEGRLTLSAVTALPATVDLATVNLTASHVQSSVHAATQAAATASTTTSTNWSGYAVQTNSTSTAVNSVSGSWTVPTVTGTGTAYSSDWVGIDGFNSNSVEQIGTDSDLTNGKPTYYAWYEMYPNNMFEIPLTISAGNSISTSVVYAGSNKFTLTITDKTTGKSYSTSQTMSGAQRSSAEWIEEAPSSNSGVLPLADFGSVNFVGCSANIGAASSITSGTSGPINNGWSNTTLYAINMVSSRNAALDTTGGLTDSGTGSAAASAFTVTYDGSTTPTPPPRQRRRHPRRPQGITTAAGGRYSGRHWPPARLTTGPRSLPATTGC